MIYGRKLGMTRVFTEQGNAVPVTVLELGPNVVTQVKTTETDGYDAIQIGYGVQKPQRLSRAIIGHISRAKKGTPRFLAEIRAKRRSGHKNEKQNFELGQEISLEGMFKVGEHVDVVGTSIGKGFAGVMKRHHMKGAQTNTHGTHEYFRHGGSIGCRKFPGRTFKNKRMPGHMGNERVIQEGLTVMAVRPSDNVLLVKGSVPGPRNSYIYVRSSLKC